LARPVSTGARDAACPFRTGEGTRRVRFVRTGGGGGELCSQPGDARREETQHDGAAAASGAVSRQVSFFARFRVYLARSWRIDSEDSCVSSSVLCVFSAILCVLSAVGGGARMCVQPLAYRCLQRGGRQGVGVGGGHVRYESM